MTGFQVEADMWLTEYLTPYDIYQHGIKEVLAHKQTAFQEMYLIDTGTYGRALVLDGQWQSSSVDEFLYHEPLVHPALVNYGAPENVLILGAGEGATLREVLKWKTVKTAVMVDIDAEVVDACRHHLAEVHQNAFDDPRAQLIIGDALDYLDSPVKRWDIIISDLSDPVEDGPSFKLFTREYFEKCRQALKPDGYFVVQAGSLSPAMMKLHVRLAKTVQTVFDNVISYGSYIPTFGEPWGYILAGNAPLQTRPDPDVVDDLLAANTSNNFHMFDGMTMLGMMQTPKHIRQAIEAETEIYTLADPPRIISQSISS